MELNRNQLFLIGLVVLAVGYHFLKVESLVFNSRVSHFIDRQLRRGADDGVAAEILAAAGPSVKQKVVEPPHWLGWCLMSVGGVFAAQALVMRKPGT